MIGAGHTLGALVTVITLVLSIYGVLSLVAFLVVMAAIISGSRTDVELRRAAPSAQKRRAAAAPTRAMSG